MTALVYIVLCLIWGSTWIGIKIGLGEAPPLYSAALRFVVAVTLLLIIVLVKRYRFPRSFRSFVKLGYPGIYMYGISYALVYLAEQHIDSSLMAVLFASFPFFVAVLSMVRLKQEKPRRIGWVGMMVGFAGVVLISVEQWQASEDLFWGTMLGIGGVYAAAHGLVVHTKKFTRENIVVAVCVQMICGGVLLFIAAIVFEDISAFQINVVSVGSVLYLAVFGSVIAFLGYYWLLRRTTAVIVSLIAFVTPLVAITIGVLLFDESVTPLIGIGTLMILSGIVAVIKKPETGKTIEN